MPTDEFWHGKPNWFLSYVEAFKLKTKRKEDADAINVDYQAWLTGLYVHQGVQVALANSFSKKSRAKYVKEPISFTRKKEETPQAKAEVEAKVDKQYLAFKLLTDAMNKNLKKR